MHGVLIPGGFGIRGIEGKIGAIRYARHRGLPVLGLCLGLQCIVIEAARSVGLTEANSAEFDPGTPDPVISTMADQRDAVAGEADLGGTMRLGAYPAMLEPGSIVAEAYQSTDISERHRHRYEVNNEYRDRIAESGLRFSGTSPDGHLVEFVEYPREVHPFLVGTQAHPELKSRPTRPHPLFDAFIGAAIEFKAAERLPVEIPEQHPNGREHPDDDAERVPSSQSTFQNPWPVADHDFDTVLIRNRLHAERFSRCAPTRCGCPAATPPRREVVEHFGAVGRRRRRRDASGSRWSTSTAIRSAAGCGSCPPVCSTSAARTAALTAARELQEEAGLAADHWRCWSTSTPRPVSATRRCGSIWPAG